MQPREHLDEDDKPLCWGCVGAEFLREQIRREGMLATCAFCEKHRKALPIEKVADLFEHTFEHLQRHPGCRFPVSTFSGVESKHPLALK
jgi:hypothetical protein